MIYENGIRVFRHGFSKGDAVLEMVLCFTNFFCVSAIHELGLWRCQSSSRDEYSSFKQLIVLCKNMKWSCGAAAMGYDPQQSHTHEVYSHSNNLPVADTVCLKVRYRDPLSIVCNRTRLLEAVASIQPCSLTTQIAYVFTCVFTCEQGQTTV